MALPLRSSPAASVVSPLTAARIAVASSRSDAAGLTANAVSGTCSRVTRPEAESCTVTSTVYVPGLAANMKCSSADPRAVASIRAGRLRVHDCSTSCRFALSRTEIATRYAATPFGPRVRVSSAVNGIRANPSTTVWPPALRKKRVSPISRLWAAAPAAQCTASAVATRSIFPSFIYVSTPIRLPSPPSLLPADAEAEEVHGAECAEALPRVIEAQACLAARVFEPAAQRQPVRGERAAALLGRYPDDQVVHLVIGLNRIAAPGRDREAALPDVLHRPLEAGAGAGLRVVGLREFRQHGQVVGALRHEIEGHAHPEQHGQGPGARRQRRRLRLLRHIDGAERRLPRDTDDEIFAAVLQVRAEVLDHERRANRPRAHRGVEVRTEIDGHAVGLGGAEPIVDELERDARGEAIGEVLRERSRDEGLAHRVRAAIPIGIGESE